MEFLEILDGELKDDPSGALRKEEIFNQLIDAYNSPDWLAIKKILSKHKCTNHVVKSIKQELHKRHNIADISPEEEPPKLIMDTVKDSPVHGLSTCPHGWAIRDYIPGRDGALKKTISKSDPLFGFSSTEISVCAVPILITERLESIHDKSVHLKVVFKRQHQWVEVVAPQSHLLNSQHIIECLGSRGLPITSNTKGDVIDYLCAYLATNDEYIPTQFVSNQMGWAGDKENRTAYGFLCGENFISNQIKTPQHKRKVVRFLGNSTGDEVEAKAISPAGTYEGWCNAIEGINKYPRAEIALYASLSSVLLEPLGLPGYVVDWSYRTSRGKTTILKAAASIWGRGEEFASDSPIKSWNTTKVGAEMLASTLNSIPIILDDTKQAPRYGGESIVPSVIYSIYNGRGRSRGTKSGGTDVTRAWRTVLLSTGEQAVTDFDKSEGTATRALCIGGEPFNRTGDEEGAYIDKMSTGLSSHYGHAGPAFVQWVVKQRPHWMAWGKTLNVLVEQYRSQLAEEHNRGVSGRIAKSLGIIELTGRLAHEALELPWAYNSPITNSIYRDVSHGADQADQAAEALNDVVGWCYTNRHKFEGTPQCDLRYGSIGKWDMSATIDDWDKIHIIAKDLRQELVHLGYDASAVLKAWKHSGISECDERRTTKRVRFSNCQVRCVVLPRAQIEQNV